MKTTGQLTQVDSKGKTILDYAISTNNEDLIIEILDHVALKDLLSDTVPYLHKLTCNSHIRDAVWHKLLERFGKDPIDPEDTLTSKGLSPFHVAVEFENEVALKYLLQWMPNVVNTQTPDGISPLHMAASKNLLDMAKDLILHHADVDVLDSQNDSPIDYALSKQHKEMAQFLRYVKERLNNAGESQDDSEDTNGQQDEQGQVDAKEVDSPAKFYLKVLNTQELLFSVVDTVMDELKRRFKDDEETDPKSETIDDASNKSLLKRLNDSIGEVKEIFLIFATKVISDHKGQSTTIQEYKEKEKEWNETASIFAQYQEKMTEKLKMLELVLRETKATKDDAVNRLKEKEEELISAYQQIIVFRDMFIRIKSLRERRSNFERIKRQLEDEESSILDDLSQLDMDA